MKVSTASNDVVKCEYSEDSWPLWKAVDNTLWIRFCKILGTTGAISVQAEISQCLIKKGLVAMNLCLWFFNPHMQTICMNFLYREFPLINFLFCHRFSRKCLCSTTGFQSVGKDLSGSHGTTVWSLAYNKVALKTFL